MKTNMDCKEEISDSDSGIMLNSGEWLHLDWQMLQVHLSSMYKVIFTRAFPLENFYFTT